MVESVARVPQREAREKNRRGQPAPRYARSLPSRTCSTTPSRGPLVEVWFMAPVFTIFRWVASGRGAGQRGPLRSEILSRRPARGYEEA